MDSIYYLAIFCMPLPCFDKKLKVVCFLRAGHIKTYLAEPLDTTTLQNCPQILQHSQGHIHGVLWVLERPHLVLIRLCFHTLCNTLATFLIFPLNIEIIFTDLTNYFVWRTSVCTIVFASPARRGSNKNVIVSLWRNITCTSYIAIYTNL